MFEDSKYLPIFGSSELSRLDEFHPSNYFQVNNQGFTPYLVGKGGDQSRKVHGVYQGLVPAFSDKIRRKALVVHLEIVGRMKLIQS